MTKQPSIQLLRSRRTFRRISLFLGFIVLNGCAHNTNISDNNSKTNYLVSEPWIQEVVNYQQQLSAEHTDKIESVLSVTQEMRDEVINKFSHLPRHRAAKELAKWLLAKDGLNMRYDVTANLTPKQAYQQRRGNCLSFTMLLSALASEIDINIEFNAVDIPHTWGMDEQLGMVFYRHVNGVLTTVHTRQIFDLAMDVYYSGYAQRFITRNQALALLLNNRAIDLLGSDQIQRAEHSLKFALSLSPTNADLWVNLGVVMKRKNNFELAELAFNYAYQLDKYNIPAASNLERLYTEQGFVAKALKFQKQADRVHKTNPYYYFQIALDEYSANRYGGALKATNQAIRLHKQDPRFYELKSLISQRQHKYNSALKSIKKAYALAEGLEQRGKYANKAVMVSQRAQEEFSRRWEEGSKGGTLRR